MAELLKFKRTLQKSNGLIKIQPQIQLRIDRLLFLIIRLLQRTFKCDFKFVESTIN